jgi:hypothetical protein
LDLGEAGISDNNIIALLHRLRQPTFFTRDLHFFWPHLCHGGYALVYLDLAAEECALSIRRFLRHSRFQTKAQRMGVVARVHHDGISCWQLGESSFLRIPWNPD